MDREALARILPDMTPDAEDAFYETIANEDVLGTVIKGLVHIENQLIRLIEQTLPNPKALRPLQLDYSGRVHLAIALGLNARFRSPLEALGSIRNKFAHRLNAEIGRAQADALYKTLSSEDRTVLQQTFERMLRRPDFARHPKRFQDEQPLDRFRLICVVLRSAIVSARIQVAKHGRDSTGWGGDVATGPGVRLRERQ